MKNLINITSLFLLFLMFTSCEKIVLGEDEINSPENNFELFWSDFDEHYGLFTARNWNWDSIYTAYRPQVTAQTTDAELWTMCTEMIEYLDDGHTFLYDRANDTFYVSGNALAEQAEEEFELDLINKYVENVTSLSDNINWLQGKMKDKDIGYIYMGNMTEEDPAKIDQVIDDLKEHQAIILDIRNNGGGDDSFSARIAGAFADGEHFIYTVQERNGPNHNDFKEKTEYYTKKAGDEQFLKPVIVLTDAYTVSAAEIFLLHIKSFAHVVQLGTTTSGDFSDTSIIRFLPNGWAYQYSTQMFLLPDGTSLDGIGHIPDVYSKNTKEDIEAENDLVLEHAVQYLWDEYGIE